VDTLNSIDFASIGVVDALDDGERAIRKDDTGTDRV